MKKILCFGDSNTFGFNPINGLRFSKEIRWTGVLQSLCGSDYEIVEAGCNNRTCFRNNPEGKKYTGGEILPEYLKSDFDIVILGLGANDLQRQYRTSIEELKYGMENLVSLVQAKSNKIHIIILSPSVIGEKVLSSRIFSFLFDETSIEKSKSVAVIYREIANINNCKFVDLEQLVKPSDIDGLHYDEVGHQRIANELYGIISNLDQ